jgi:hypothetical protein
LTRGRSEGNGGSLLRCGVDGSESITQRSITATVSPSGEVTGPRHSRPARSFYEHLIPEFERSPTDPLHLLLLLKDIRCTLGR